MSFFSASESIEQRRAKLLRGLLDHRHLVSTGVRGVYGRGAGFERIVRGIEAMVDPWASSDGAEPVYFPPVMSRASLRKTTYLENFPQLCGSVHSFVGDDLGAAKLATAVKAGDDWGPHLSQAEIVLAPAACYPLYPTLAGTLPESGGLYDLSAYCFRHEPSEDPARMQSFRMRENVRLGSAEQVQDWRSTWMDRTSGLLNDLQLPGRLDTASDPFFGRGGRLMKANQKAQQLKFELLIPIFSEEDPTACASFNYHQDYFGQTFDIRTSNGEPAHTACLGFGLERLTIALLRIHGLDLGDWPAEVRARLGL